MLAWLTSLASRTFGLIFLSGFQLGGEQIAMLCPTPLIFWVCLYLQSSLGAFRSWLLEHGAYLLLLPLGVVSLLWYVMSIASRWRLFLFA